jgi:hypothetical protein
LARDDRTGHFFFLLFDFLSFLSFLSLAFFAMVTSSALNDRQAARDTGRLAVTAMTLTIHRTCIVT